MSSAYFQPAGKEQKKDVDGGGASADRDSTNAGYQQAANGNGAVLALAAQSQVLNSTGEAIPPSFQSVASGVDHAIYGDINCPALIDEVEFYLGEIRRGLADPTFNFGRGQTRESTAALLRATEGQLATITGATERLEAEFDTAPLPGRSRQDPTRTKKTIADELSVYVRRLRDLLADVQALIRITEGGFGAQARATEIEGVDIGAKDAPVAPGSEIDNTFIANISINGAKLTDASRVARPRVPPTATNDHRLVNGRTPTSRPPLDPVLPTTFRDTLPALTIPQTAPDVISFNGIDRGPGQAAEMGNTNARGYAWATNTPDWDRTDWEWLHLRGASLGGVTGPANLVLGTRDANTQMIPFEANLKTLAGSARSQPTRFTGLTVTWTAASELTPHKWSTVSIDWRLNVAGGAPSGFNGRAQFAPLATGSVLSKTEVGFLEKALKDARQAAEPPVEENDIDHMVDEDDHSSLAAAGGQAQGQVGEQKKRPREDSERKRREDD